MNAHIHIECQAANPLMSKDTAICAELVNDTSTDEVTFAVKPHSTTRGTSRKPTTGASTNIGFQNWLYVRKTTVWEQA